MAEINGKPMIGHVYERADKCNLLTKTVVATCDSVIKDYIQSIGGHAVMTSNKHERASDRTAEALEILEQMDQVRYDIIVMVQGDEPMTEPEMISEAVRPMLEDDSIGVVNLVADIKSEEEFLDKNCIKVVTDLESNALFFSREPIPTQRISSNASMRKQVCVIPFRRDFLFQYQDMEPTPLEIAESVDMMRVLENGFKVKMVPTSFETSAVDTEEDLIKVRQLMKE